MREALTAGPSPEAVPLAPRKIRRGLDTANKISERFLGKIRLWVVGDGRSTRVSPRAMLFRSSQATAFAFVKRRHIIYLTQMSKKASFIQLSEKEEWRGRWVRLERDAGALPDLVPLAGFSLDSQWIR
jgi:hypothetical protein